MEPFKFSLKKVQNFRENILKQEKNKLSILNSEKNEMVETIAYLEKSMVKNKKDMHELSRSGVNAFQLSSFNYLISNSQKQIEQLRIDIIEIDEKIKEQLKIVIAASKEKTSLDKLEEKKKEEYDLLFKKAEETNMLEHVTIAIAKEHQ